MQYRRLSPSGDYTMGKSLLTGVEAVAQAVKTRLQLNRGDWWRDLSDGLPLTDEILGTSGSPANLAAVDGLIQNRIKGTEGVTGIVEYSSDFDPLTRAYTYTATIQTDYSTTVVSGTL